MMLNFSLKPIGGEQEIDSDDLFYEVTNSGRSSLRWALLSMELQGKRILVPDFICQVVIDILNEYNMQIHFYNVQEDFEFFLPSCLDNYDALYVVKYFGHESVSFKKTTNNNTLPLIIDGVFDVQRPHVNLKSHWCYFNSLRKISAIADFSQIISNKPLFRIAKKNIPEFSMLKYKAKEIKHAFINNSKWNEKKYLDLFSTAECLINDSHDIYHPEGRSIYLTSCFYSKIHDEISHRKKNLMSAIENLKKINFIGISPEFPSFLPLLLNKRDDVRYELMRNSIYLAIHWPTIEQSKNSLSDRVISIPLDSRYSDMEIKHICNIISKVENE
ncbi:aspartate aminotransferase family protein [Aeromonas popoffii]|uniref:pyridoxal phosphate-dependent transferase n=1 Tax=Aeromonas popoffii TaxID=70856 RepID=UPI000A02FC65|nr:pyridoxal phosphate-dependent transferase [Aeromonas popoffii]